MAGRHAQISSTALTTEQIRNVVLVGPAGSGKSALFAHLTGSDVAESTSGALRVATIERPDALITLLDAPGYADFVGTLRAGLRAADAAVFVLSATDTIDVAAAQLWRECEAVGLPRAVVVTKLDLPRADFGATIAHARQVLGDGIHPLGVPIVSDGVLTHVVDLMLGEVHDYSGDERTVHPTDDAHAPLFDEFQGPLLEAIIEESEDETLMERYIGGEQIPFSVVEPDLLTAVSRGRFFPAISASTQTDAGLDVLLHLIVHGFPAPAGRPMPRATSLDGRSFELTGAADGPLAAEVVQTTADPYVGQICLVRVFTGTLTRDAAVHVSGHRERFGGPLDVGHDEETRIGGISVLTADGAQPINPAPAGAIVAIPRLATAQTSDTISAAESPLVIEPWNLPEPRLPTALVPATHGDDAKLPDALRRLAAVDPSVRVVHDEETGQTVLWTMGQLHLDASLQALAEIGRVQVESEDVRIPLRETVRSSARGEGRHVKQSGGHGQYAVCRIEVEPLPRGSGFEFVDKVAGGAVPRQFIGSVEKGVRSQMATGVGGHGPLVDLRVTLYDGKAHSVDSSDAAFQSAGALALREAVAAAGVIALEPIDTLQVTVADEHVGAAMSDLSARRARISGTDSGVSPGTTVITAEVPRSLTTRYALDLVALSHGTGTFTQRPSGYEALP